MAASLITKVIADISQLEKDLKRAETRWAKYEEVARKAASLTLTGGSLGGGSGGGGSTATLEAKNALRQKELELKASLKRQELETKASLEAQAQFNKGYYSSQLADQKAYHDRQTTAIKSAFAEDLELTKQAGARQKAELQNQLRVTEQLSRETQKFLAKPQTAGRARSQGTEDDLFAELQREEKKRSEAFHAPPDSFLAGRARAESLALNKEAIAEADKAEAAIVAERIARERQLQEVRAGTLKRAAQADHQREQEEKQTRAAIVADEVALEKRLEALRADTLRRASAADRQRQKEEKEADRERVKSATQADKEIAGGRRALASDLRSQIRFVTGGSGFGANQGGGPPFRPIPTGSRPEDIRALQQHLAEAESTGARLSRTLRRVGQEDLRNAEQSARFFANALKLAAGAAIIGGFAALVREGINLNREWERFRFGLGTALALTSKVVDAQGNVVSGSRAFRVFAADGEKLFRTIRAEANKTILTTEELVEVVTTNFSQAIRAGIPEKEIIGLTSRIAQVAKSLGLQGGTPQLVQEVRAILSGDIRRGATVAQVLGLTSKEVQNAREAGNLIQLLNKRLEGAKPIVDAFGKSSEAAFTTLASKGQDFLRLSLEEVFKRITGRVLNFNEALSDDKIRKFAGATGKVLSELLKPVENFLDSGRGEKLAETFVKAFKAVGDFANSAAFDNILKLFNYLVDHHVELLLVIGAFQGFRALNAVNSAVGALGRPGGLLAGTAVGQRLAGGIPGLFANTATAAGGGFLTNAAAGAALGSGGAAAAAGGGLVGLLARLGFSRVGLAAGLTTAILPTIATDIGLESFRRRQGAELSLEEQQQGLGREPGLRNRVQRNAINQDALRQVLQQIQAATLRGERVTTGTKFPVALGGDQERTLQLSFDQAKRRLAGEQELQEKLARVVKEGGDHRVSNEVGANKQILDLQRIQGVLRTAQLQGDVRRQIELETALKIAQAEVDEKGNKKFYKNERERGEEIRAARQEGARKLADLDRKAAEETGKLEAEAAQNRRRERQVELQKDLFEVRQRVFTKAITPEQGERQEIALRQKARNEDLRQLRETRDRATEIVDAYTKRRLSAAREQRKGLEEVGAFERQIARQARDLARERIDAERSVTEAIVQQARTREDVGLRRETRAQRLGIEGAIAGGELGSQIRFQAGQRFTTGGGLLATEGPQIDRHAADLTATRLIRELAASILSSGALTEVEIRKQVSEELKAKGINVTAAAINQIARQLAQTNIAAGGTALAGENLQRGREAEEIGGAPGLSLTEQNELIRLQQQQAVGNQTGALRLRDLERRRTAATTGTAVFGATHAVQERQEALAKTAEQETDARREAAKQLTELQLSLHESRVSLEKDLLGLGKQARELQPDLKAFGDILGVLKNEIGEIAKLTPAGAAAQARAAGPRQVNLTVDLKGGLGEGTITDPIVQVVLDRVLQRLQHDLKRGPVGAR